MAIADAALARLGMTMGWENWPAIAAARCHDAQARWPFFIGNARAGSVARRHLAALAEWPKLLQLDDQAVQLQAEDADAALRQINAGLFRQGLIRAWRDEVIAVPDLDHPMRSLARMERAAARFWGSLTLGAHANGYLADEHGRPTHLWIARRSLNKATDPGLHDNVVAGGVPDGQSPFQALQREAWEEAGLQPGDLQELRPGRVIHLLHEVPEGLKRETLHSFDLRLAPGLTPRNQDGEVAGFELLPVAQALALAAGDAMTVDASLVTLDFGLRHGRLEAPAGFAALLAPP